MRVDCTGTWLLLAASLLGLQCKDGKGGDESPAEPPAGIEAIAILPLDGADLKAVDYVAHRLADSFKTKVYVWQPGVMPANAWYAPRKRYWADSVLKWMRPKAAESGLKLMAITGKDIATKMGNKYN